MYANNTSLYWLKVVELFIYFLITQECKLFTAIYCSTIALSLSVSEKLLDLIMASLIERNDLVWLRPGRYGQQNNTDSMCYVSDVRKSPMGWSVFDLVDMNGRIHRNTTRMDFFTVEQQDLQSVTCDDIVNLLSGDIDMPAQDMPAVLPLGLDSSVPDPENTKPSVAEEEVDENTPPGPDGSAMMDVPEADQDDEKTANSRRFNPVSDQLLDELANSTTAKSTDYQTKWAVRTFRGNIYVSFIIPGKKTADQCLHFSTVVTHIVWPIFSDAPPPSRSDRHA